MKFASLFLMGLLFLSGCGFQPIYGTHPTEDGVAVADDLNNVSIENIPDKNGQILRNYLVDRMYGSNRPTLPGYTLKVQVHSAEEQLGILANATTTRALMNMYADYTMTDSQGKLVLKGSAHSVAGFDLQDQMYGTVASRLDANDRTLHEVSEQIVNRISLYFSERKKL